MLSLHKAPDSTAARVNGMAHGIFRRLPKPVSIAI